MEFRKVLVQSRKLPAQKIEALWENMYMHNVKTDTLNSILAFYIHHRIYPPPVQRAFDTLLVFFTGTKLPKKLRTVLFQTVEEMCLWLNPSCIADTVRLSTSPSVVAELLSCLLINKDIPCPENIVYERLLSALTIPGLSQDSRAKVLGFLMATIPAEMEPSLNRQLTTWLSYCRTRQTTGSLFRSADVMELDGSPGMGTCTALTLVANVTDLHILSLVAFSNIRRYLLRLHGPVDEQLLNAVFNYCSTLLAQASKKPNSQHDKQLVPVVLEEVLLVMRAVREVDNSCKARCQLTVGNIQHLAEQLRLVAVLVSVWEYYMSQDGESSLTDRILGAMVNSEFSQGVVSERVTAVSVAHVARLAGTLAQYSPNLLKLAATHPSALVEQFLDIVPYLASSQDFIVEVLHSLLDLPTLSASICVHQTALLVQAGFKIPVLVSVKQRVEAEHATVYRHMLRTQARPGETNALLKFYPRYWSELRPVLSLGLVEVCAQVAPVLLQAFLDSVCDQCELSGLLLPDLLARVSLLCPLPAYQQAVYDVMVQYTSHVFSHQPELLGHKSVLQFVSVTSHTQLCPQLFDIVVSAIGQHVRTEQLIESYFECLDGLLREMLIDRTTPDLKLETSICTTLAKLASQHVTLIPRAIAVFEKVSQTFQDCTEEVKEAITQRTKELIRMLKNPRVASVVLAPSSKEDVAVAALLRVLFQFLD